jgi:hypothetical protein
MISSYKTYWTWMKEKSLKTLAKKFISNNLDLMFNIEKVVRHIWYMKSKQNSSRISLQKP